jgi:hypothetical protein
LIIIKWQEKKVEKFNQKKQQKNDAIFEIIKKQAVSQNQQHFLKF